MPPTEKGVSRREFARRAALGAASASLLPLASLQPIAETLVAKTATPATQSPADGPKLSPQSQLEAEFRWKSIVEQYSDRFTDTQKADLKRLCIFVQPSLDRLRAYTVGNGDLPGLYLKPLVERDKKPSPAAAATKPGKS